MIELTERRWMEQMGKVQFTINIVPGAHGSWAYEMASAVNSDRGDLMTVKEEQELFNQNEKQLFRPEPGLDKRIRDAMDKEDATQLRITIMKLPRGFDYQLSTTSTRGAQWMKVALGLECIEGLTLSDLDAAASALTKQIHNTVTTRTENKDNERLRLTDIRDRIRRVAAAER